MPRFPLDVKVPAYDVTSGQRQFGWNRGGRLHAGCDLYAPLGTLVRAIADGEVVYTSTNFTEAKGGQPATGAIAVYHPGLEVVVRYAEILVPSEYDDHQTALRKGYAAAALELPEGAVVAPKWTKGDAVEEGDVLGALGQVANVRNPMLHFELFGSAARDGVFRGKGVYSRVDSLLDPTDFLESLEEGGELRPGRKPSGVRALGASATKGRRASAAQPQARQRKAERVFSRRPG